MIRRAFLARIAALAVAMRARPGSALPPDDPSITDEMWLEEARTHFPGRIIVGKDLMEI